MDAASSRSAASTALRVGLAVAVAGVALFSAFAARRGDASAGTRPRKMRACADKPGSSRELLQLASSHVRWLAGSRVSSAAKCNLRPLTMPVLRCAAMKRKYELTDIGKALRICVMYAASLDADAAAALLSPVHAAKDDPGRGREEGDFALRGAQRAWLTAATARCARPRRACARALTRCATAGAGHETRARQCDGSWTA